MIAVFAPVNSIRVGQLRPANMFKMIQNASDIKGINFTGIIEIQGWFLNSADKQVAHRELMRRQPELNYKDNG